MADKDPKEIIFRIPDNIRSLKAARLHAPEGQEVVGLVIPGHIRSVNWESCPFRNIRSLVVEEGVGVIGDHAFNGCEYLESVCLPDTLRRIGEGAFLGTALRQLELPENLKELGSAAFDGCEFLTSVRLPASLRKLPACIFERTGLTSICLPEGIEEIGPYAFQYCFALEQVSLPGTLRTIGAFAFEDTGLRKVIIPEGTEVVGICAFASCFQLKEVRLPASLRILDSNCLTSDPFPYTQERGLHLVFRGVPKSLINQYLPQAKRVTILADAPWQDCVKMIECLQLPKECELVADRIPLRGLQPYIQMRIFRAWDSRLRRGEPIPEEAKANLLDGAKSRRSALWRAGILRQLLLEEGLLSLQNVQTFLKEAQREGDHEAVAQLLEYEHRHFPPEEVERRERRKRQRALKDL